MTHSITKSLYFLLKCLKVIEKHFEDFHEYETTPERKVKLITRESVLNKCVNIIFEDQNQCKRSFLKIIKYY